MKTYSINQPSHYIVKNGKLVKKQPQNCPQTSANYRVISYNPSKLVENVTSSMYDQQTIRRLNNQISQLKNEKKQMMKQIEQNKDAQKLRFSYQSQIERLKLQNVIDKKRYQEKLETLQRHYSERGRIIQDQTLQISIIKSNVQRLQDYIDQLVVELQQEKKKNERHAQKSFKPILNTAVLKQEKLDQQRQKTIRKYIQSPVKPLCHQNDRIRTMQSESGNDIRKSIIFGMMNIGTVRNTKSSHNMFKNLNFVKFCDSQEQIQQKVTTRKQRIPNL